MPYRTGKERNLNLILRGRNAVISFRKSLPEIYIYNLQLQFSNFDLNGNVFRRKNLFRYLQLGPFHEGYWFPYKIVYQSRQISQPPDSLKLKSCHNL